MSASILLVDDDPLLVQLMGAMLADLGQVRFATDGPSALQQVASEAPDLILLDAQMPGMSGFEVCQALKSSAESEEIPIIFVTAHSDEEFEVRCFELGAADFIRKPVSRETLRARVRTQVRLKQALDTIRRLALHDSLTGLANRRAFDALLAREWKQALRQGVPLGVLMIDIDRFKQYNDTYGHPAGDACLASVAHAIEQSLLRPQDAAARYGGEEFVVLLPGTGEDGVRTVAGRMLAAVRALRIPHPDSASGGLVSISVGGAVHAPSSANGGVGRAAGEASDGLIQRADAALYAAKQQGRARFCLAGPVANPGAPGAAA